MQTNPQFKPSIIQKKEMRGFLLYCIIGFTFTLFTSCEADDSLATDEHFIFGTYFGFCFGNCTHLFKYENDQVFRDEMDRFLIDDLIFSEIGSIDLNSTALELFRQFPQLLRDSTKETYGCPDCADQGTLFLQIKKENTVRSWFIDTRIQEDWPDELKAYHLLLTEKLAEIVQ